MKTERFTIEELTTQFEEMNRNCALSEALMAQTLATRIATCPDDEEVQGFICDWFRSVRHMAVANFISARAVVKKPEQPAAAAAAVAAAAEQLLKWAVKRPDLGGFVVARFFHKDDAERFFKGMHNGKYALVYEGGAE